MMADRFLLAVLVATVLLSARDASAQPADLGKYSNFTPFQEKWLTTEPRDPSLEWLIAYGGRLYDNWIEMVGRGAPRGNHPVYPRAGKQVGPSTWRCKECHGWDYNGKDGAYGNPANSHYTGIKGIRAFAGKDPKAVIEILRDKTHGLDDRMLPKYAAERLALFVARGQVKAEDYLKPDGSPNGDVNKGRAVFQTVCAVCHGYDGKSINFGSGNKPAYIGTVANGNFPELLHKARNGHPGAIMIPQIALEVQRIIDVAAYARHLPQK
jgi:thiosulfate dehydrogenase